MMGARDDWVRLKIVQCRLMFQKREKKYTNFIEKIQSTMTPPVIFPSFEKLSSINFPKRLELLLYTVLALPNASNIGLKKKKIENYLVL